MLGFLKSLVDAAVFLIAHFIELIFFIPKMLGMFTESVGLIATGIGFAPVFLLPILTMLLAVAIIMWLVNLL